MSKMKKTILIALGGIFWAAAIIFAVTEAYRIVSREAVANNMGPFESFDSAYDLILDRYTIDGASYMSFYVEDRASGDIIYKCSEGFSLSKLRYITWKENSLDIIIMSSEAGFITYSYENRYWVRMD